VPTNLQLTRASKHHSYFATNLHLPYSVSKSFKLSSTNHPCPRANPPSLKNATSRISIQEHSVTVHTEPDPLSFRSLYTKTIKLKPHPTPKSSLWKLPGLDKETFYAAALYLHVVRVEFERKPLVRFSETPEATQDFLDRLADCFARSKLQDARDDVSATPMVRNEEQKKITLYIAKNQSEKGCGPLAYRDELSVAANENKVFADELVRCFNTLAKEGSTHTEHPDVFKTMYKFSQSRLEYYIGKIS
jgi:hypothetical protein